MKKLLFAIILLTPIRSIAQVGEWTWMHGDQLANSSGSFGTQGVSSPSNVPPPRYEAAEWTDLQGNFWMFGGNGLSGRYNDLWKFDPATIEWTWVSGSNGIDQLGNYGSQGVSSPSNVPGARGFGIATWVDNNGDLWMFGGSGYALVSSGELNDLWKYNISSNEWTWVKGSNGVNDPGNYGIKLIPDPLNVPKSRHETSITWVDDAGDLWLFGGDHTFQHLNDLWKYDINANELTWMHGDPIPDQAGVYGTQGLSSPSNTPGSRWSFAKWRSNGKFYLVGGAGYDASGTYGRLNDIWRFDPMINEWTWVNGSNTAEPDASMDPLCISNPNNSPSGRMENRASWQDTCGNFVMFGGYNLNGYYNDLWSYYLPANEWTWIGGDPLPDQPAVYGTILISSPLNKPSARWGSVGWKDLSGDLWLFGGNYNGSEYLNDLWKFTPDPHCMCKHVGIDDIRIEPPFTIHPNPSFGHQFNVSINLPIHDEYRLILYDAQGKMVKEEHASRSNGFTVQCEDLSDGIYFLQVSSSSFRHTERVVLSR